MVVTGGTPLPSDIPEVEDKDETLDVVVERNSTEGKYRTRNKRLRHSIKARNNGMLMLAKIY